MFFKIQLVLLTFTVCRASRFTPPRQELSVLSGPAGLISALNYKCENDATKTCQGIKHMEALFGITSYGERKDLHLYDGTPNPGSAGCPPVTYSTDSFKKPFVLLINRGVCKFTEKVRLAEGAGASAVIIVDNVAMLYEPLCVCPDYSIPKGKNGRSCTARDHADDCKCPSNGVCLPVASAPTCDAGQGFPQYEETCSDSTITGGCWKCGPTYYNSDCNQKDDRTHCLGHFMLPFMADDGYGGDITIPSVLISDYYGSLLRLGLKNDPTMVMKMEWNLPLLARSTLELWTSSEDGAGSDFKLDFKETYMRLQEHLDFQPRYYIFDGHALKCDKKYDCGTQCISKLYCGRDPDGAMGKGVEGKDIVMENLRQMCIWKVLAQDGGAPPGNCFKNSCESGWVHKNTGCAATGQVVECMNSDGNYECCGATKQDNTKDLMKWWCYVNDFSDSCFDGTGTAMDSSESFDQCAVGIMKDHDIDATLVNDCIAKSFADSSGLTGVNSLLAAEITARHDYSILTLPTAVVNGRELRGNTASGESMVANVARAVCQGYQTVPSECDRILNPSGANRPSDGNLGVINFAATLKYSSTSPPTLTPESYSLNDVLQHRVSAALALKIGANPDSLTFEQAVDGTDPNTVVVGVKLSNLKCKGDDTTHEDVKSALKKIADCGEDIGDGGEDAADEELEAMQSFNVHSGGTEVLTVSIGQVTEDKTLCEEPPSHTDDGKSDGTFDPSTDQIDPGTKNTVPACCSDDPSGECCGQWRAKYDTKNTVPTCCSDDPSGECCGQWRAKYDSNEVASGGYGGGSMTLMFFLGMFTVAIVGVGVVFYLRKRHLQQGGGAASLQPVFSSSTVGTSETDYDALTDCA